MKIAIPVNEQNIKAEVSPSFGRAMYYYIYDIQDKSGMFLENTATKSAGGAGIKAAQLLIDNRVKTVIAPRYGENAAQVLVDANVAVYRNIAGSVENNIKAYENNELNVLADIHSGYHNHHVQ